MESGGEGARDFGIDVTTTFEYRAYAHRDARFAWTNKIRNRVTWTCIVLTWVIAGAQIALSTVWPEEWYYFLAGQLLIMFSNVAFQAYVLAYGRLNRIYNRRHPLEF